jgi:hypothetical protein
MTSLKRNKQSKKPNKGAVVATPATEAAGAPELLAKINEAVAAVNEAETKATTAQAEVTAAQGELVSRSRTAGLLLLDAKKLHPAVKDFVAFLKRVQGLKLSRAYDLMRLAGGRTTDEELRKEARERKQKSRANKKEPPKPTLKKPEPEPEPEPVSVTTPHVTETPSAEKRKAEYADLDQSRPEERAAKMSAHFLAEFTHACHAYLPKITVEGDRQKARRLVAELTNGKPKAEAA